MKKTSILFTAVFLALILLGTSTAVFAGRQCATDSIGVSQPQTTWYLAEGATAGGFETWVLIQNPGTSTANVQLNYQTDKGEVPGPALQVAPKSRQSINVADTVQTYNVSTVVSSNRPVVSERAVYFGNRTCATDSIGTSAPQTTWYLAEGATYGGFETWVLVQNPGTSTASVQLKYQTDQGEEAGPSLQVPPKSRRTVNVAETVQTYHVSTMVSSNVPVVAERAMYFGNRECATDSIGVTSPNVTWYLAEGATYGGFETWVLVQNPGTSTANVRLTYQTDQGETPGPSVQVPPKSRKTVNVADTVQTFDVSTVVASDTPVVAERAVYFGNRTCATDSIGVSEPQTTWYLAEGATAGGFETWVLIQNPGTSTANVQLNYQTDKGEVPGPALQVAPKSRQSINVADTVQTYNVSTVVSSNRPVVSERAVYYSPPEPSTLTVKFLNVGEADSCVLKIQNQTTTFFALVDTGKSDAAGHIISDLQAMGCGRINVLVLTHPDADHVGSAVSVMNTFPVNEVWDPGIDGSNSQTWQQVKSTIAAKGIPRTRPTSSQVYNWNGVQTAVYNPPSTTYSETNDNSIVLVESLGAEDVLLLGDTQSAAQQYMTSEAFPTIELSKASHHGGDSGYYAPFFDKVRPSNSVISVGPNSYGHPSQAVINALATFGTVYRTDTNGDVTATVTTGDLQISTESAPAPSPSPSPSPTPSPGPFIGSVNSNVYHYPSCSYVAKIKPENRVTFGNAQEAVNAGYHPCSVCNPPLP